MYHHLKISQDFLLTVKMHFAKALNDITFVNRHALYDRYILYDRIYVNAVVYVMYMNCIVTYGHVPPMVVVFFRLNRIQVQSSNLDFLQY